MKSYTDIEQSKKLAEILPTERRHLKKLMKQDGHTIKSREFKYYGI